MFYDKNFVADCPSLSPVISALFTVEICTIAES